jgi:DNA ligase-1
MAGLAIARGRQQPPYHQIVDLADLVAASRGVAEVGGRLEKVSRLASLLARVPPDEIETAVAFLSGYPRQGRIGVGHAAISAAAATPPADGATLGLADIDAAFGRLAALAGKGSAAERARLLRELFSRATRVEQEFLARLLYGELRQGALEGVLLEAVARAASIPAARIRRAAMMAGDLGVVARAALTEGDPALDAFTVRLMQPVQPMLAESADAVDEALGRVQDAAVEYKLDGARIQVHKAEDEVRIFSRTLLEVTGAAPEIVETVRALPARELILDGEAIALGADGTPHPFQTTMRRFGRRLDVDRLRRELPLSAFLFDALYVDGQALLDEPFERRATLLGEMAPALVVPRVVRPTTAEAEAFARDALARGHEGVLVKALAAPYAAGRRGAAWIKVKQARTLDLVVLAAEWGHGRRRGWLSNLHLGARDPESNSFVMLGKTFKGMTDAMLEWQTARLLELEIGRDDYTVHVRPELVVEIAFNDLQASPVYPGGLALRFARVKRYRTDKTAAEADTIQTVTGLAVR